VSLAARSLLLVTLLLLAAPAGALRLAPAPSKVAEARALASAAAAPFASLPTGQAGIAAVTHAALLRAGYPDAHPALPRSPSLDAAILSLYGAIGQPVDAALRARVATQTAALSPEWRAALLPLVDATTASALADQRILAPADRALLLQNPALTSLLVSQVDSGAAVTPQMRALHDERMAALSRVDRAALADAAVSLADAASSFSAPAAPASCDRMLDLPFIVVGGACDDTYTDTYAIQIDNGGNDTYLDNAGGGSAIPALAMDFGAGSDYYYAPAVAQGAGLAAAGILYDDGGSDYRNASQFAQGSGNAGFGLLYDAGADNDTYVSPTGPVVSDLNGSQGSIGTKASAVGGVGILVDEGGNDFYRQDGLDGFVYGGAEGFGLLLERGGSDRYVSNEVPVTLLGTDEGTFAGPVQVSAEADGTAILVEQGGNDSYFMGPHIRQGGQGEAGVGAFCLLDEESGDDSYAMGPSIVEPQLGLFPVATGQGGAYAIAAPPGPAVGILHDAAGEDTYVADGFAQGYGVGGLGALLDDAGHDVYSTTPPLVGARADGSQWADGEGGVGVDSA